jgi:hypothetical protein
MPVVGSTVTRLKRLIPIDPAEASKDALLTDVLSAVSREIERYIGYDLEQKTYTELYSVHQNDELVLLRQIPVVSITSVKVSSTSDFASGTTLVAADEYRLREGADGVLWCDPAALVAGVNTLQVVYVAGLGVDTSAVIAAAPDLAFAIDLQAAEEYRRGTAPSTLSRPGPRGARGFTGEHRLLPRVQELLAPFRRVLVPGGTPSIPTF